MCLSILQVWTHWILGVAREQSPAAVPFLSGGNGGTELVKSRAWIQTPLWFRHPCSSAVTLLPLWHAFAACLSRRVAGLREDGNANCLALQWWAASDACNRELRVFSFVISRCFLLNPPPPPGRGFGPLCSLSACSFWPTTLFISFPSHVSIPKSPVG